jgi:hypothetical protein
MIKNILLIIILLAGGYFGYTYYQNRSNTGIKVKIDSSVVQDAQPLNPDVNLNNDYKAQIYTVTVTNNSDTEFVLLPSEYFSLHSGSNTYELSPDAAVDEPLVGGPIQPGQSVSGQISFHAPSNRNTQLQFKTDVDANWQKL